MHKQWLNKIMLFSSLIKWIDRSYITSYICDMTNMSYKIIRIFSLSLAY